jgi:hypothetical protein
MNINCYDEPFFIELNDKSFFILNENILFILYLENK